MKFTYIVKTNNLITVASDTVHLELCKFKRCNFNLASRMRPSHGLLDLGLDESASQDEIVEALRGVDLFKKMSNCVLSECQITDDSNIFELKSVKFG